MGKGNDPNCSAGAAMNVGALEQISAQVTQAAPRVARLGSWPAYISPVESLASRIPTEGQGPASGFDAGIACCLDLIPRDKQRLAAQLHAAYTPAAIDQVLREAEDLDPNSETCWWLAACSVCEEGAVDADKFSKQLRRFRELASDSELRVRVAVDELVAMRSRYQTREDGTAYGEDDGCMQGAYVDGHTFAGMRDPNSGLFFLGTFHPSLGLEDFPFSDRRDEQDRPMSGGVHGSRQFVKCADREEYEAALEKVKEHFNFQGVPKEKPAFENGDAVQIDSIGYEHLKAGAKGRIKELAWIDPEDGPVYRVQFGSTKLAAHQYLVPEYALNQQS